MVPCVICDNILEAYAKLLEEKGAWAEKIRLLKTQRDHVEQAHSTRHERPSAERRRIAA
jgi:hypothetical protein